jgi:hypothetical protein
MSYANLTFQVQPNLEFKTHDFVTLRGTNNPTTTTTSSTTTTTTVASIVSSGLILNLDASNPASYSGSGTTWTDLTGNGYNATAQGSVPFTSAGQQSYFTFNGSTSNYFLGNNNLYGTNSNQISGNVGVSISFIVNISNVSARSFLFSNFLTNKGYFIEIGTLGGVYTNTLRSYITSNSATISSDNRGTSSVLSNGTICLVTFTWDQETKTNNLYYNNILIPQNRINTNTSSLTSAWANAANYMLGADPQFGGVYGNMYTAYVYNRALTAEEVTQNYNVLQSRFGL